MLSFANSNPLKIELFVRARLVWIHLAGNASGSQVRELERELHRAEFALPERVIIDMADLDSLSAAALRSLVSFRHAIRRQGGWVTIVGANHPVQAALDHSGALPLFAAG